MERPNFRSYTLVNISIAVYYDRLSYFFKITKPYCFVQHHLSRCHFFKWVDSDSFFDRSKKKFAC